VDLTTRVAIEDQDLPSSWRRPPIEHSLTGKNAAQEHVCRQSSCQSRIRNAAAHPIGESAVTDLRPLAIPRSYRALIGVVAARPVAGIAVTDLSLHPTLSSCLTHQGADGVARQVTGIMVTVHLRPPSSCRLVDAVGVARPAADVMATDVPMRLPTPSSCSRHLLTDAVEAARRADTTRIAKADIVHFHPRF
jgi:hypothetical protein